MSLFIDQLKNNEFQTFTISSEFGSVTCLISENISLSFKSEWSGKDSKQENLKKLNEYKQQWVSLIRGLGGNLPDRAETMSFQSLATSVVFWRDADYMRLSLPCLLVATKASDDVRQDFKFLARGVLPTYEGMDFAAANLVHAPNGYVPAQTRDTDRQGIQGAYSLRIAGWLSTPRWFVMTDCKFEFSKQVTSRGVPLFAKGNVDFQSYRYLGWDDVTSLMP
jgi:hypothetical protein